MERSHADDGFTLIELLIVIVILGVLSTVTVFAVRGITDQGQTAACDTELKNIATSEEAHYVLIGVHGSGADLFTNGTMATELKLYDVTLEADGTWAAAPAAGSNCTRSATGGGTTASNQTASAPDRTTYAVSVASTSSGSFHGNPGSFQVTPSPSEPDEVVVFGRTNGLLDWHDMLNSGQPGTQRVTFVNLNNASAASITDAISQARNNGATTVAYYPSDDSAGTDGATITQIWNGNPDDDDRSLETLVAAPAAGKTLTQLLNQIG